MNEPGLPRRDFLKALGLGAGSLASLGALGSMLRYPARATGAASPTKRFVQINLEGGWDSSYATDPIVGAKTGSNTYADFMRSPSADLQSSVVPGKAKLMIGPGLIPAAPAFAAMPTAFVNGMFTEVTAHDFAAQYMSSGRLSLSNSRDYPAIPAILGAALPTYPSHVALGSLPPLGDTRFTTPPLHASVLSMIAAMVNGPEGNRYKDGLIADAHKLIGDLDDLTYGQLPAAHKESLALWKASNAQLDEVYARKLGALLTITEEVRSRYGIDVYPGEEESGPEATLASLYLMMAGNLCPYLTVSIASFDSHGSPGSPTQQQVHLPLMRRFAAALSVLVQDLKTTSDPASPGQTLADTTTLYITSEFVRTPEYNGWGGTEHWQSASAIVMGATVRDNVVIGATGNDATALGWDGSQPQLFTRENQLIPSHLIATLVAQLGTQQQADEISKVRLNGLFV